MALSAFADKKAKPTEADVLGILGDAGSLWMGIRDHVFDGFSPVVEEWKNYGQASGWCVVLKHRKRTVVYLFPNMGYLTVNLVFGERALEAAEASGLPEQILRLIRDARPYVEGRSFQVEVRNHSDVETVRRLIDIKMAN